MSIFYTLIVTLAGHELGLGPGAEPPEVHGFWAINNCQMSMLFIPYFVTLVGRELVWGPGCEKHPEVQGFWAINYCKMSTLLCP